MTSDPPPPKRPATRTGRPTRADPPESCPVKDRCRRARAGLCLDCELKKAKRRGIGPRPKPVAER